MALAGEARYPVDMSLRDHLTPTFFGETLTVQTDGTLAFGDGKPLAKEQLVDVLYLSEDELAVHVQAKRSARGELQASASSPKKKSWFADLPSLGQANVPSAAAQKSEVSDDVALLLAGISSSTSIALPKVEIDAGFFHLSLLRWLGLLDDDQGELAARWSYDFWRADIVPVEAAELQGVPAGAQVYEATVYANDVEAGRDCFDLQANDAFEKTADDDDGDEVHFRHAAQAHRYFVLFDDEQRILDAGWLSSPPDLLEPDEKRSSTFSILPATTEEVWQQALFDGDDSLFSD